jgi:hypothetical protein
LFERVAPGFWQVSGQDSNFPEPDLALGVST